MLPRYDIAVQNWTSNIVHFGNLNYSTLPEDYAGEIIPPYALLRIVGPLRYFKGTPYFPVALPDDDSELWQQAGLHFLNGPNPIQLATFDAGGSLPASGGFGYATQDFPAPVLTDFDSLEPSPTPYDPFDSVGVPLRIKSGTWALSLTDIDTQFAPYVGLSAFGVSDRQATGGVLYTYKAHWVSAYGREPAGGF